jgi:hypothetical protein
MVAVATATETAAPGTAMTAAGAPTTAASAQTSGVVHANVGQNVTSHNPSLGLFLYHFLHMMSL